MDCLQVSAKIENGHAEAGEKIYIMPKAESAVIKCKLIQGKIFKKSLAVTRDDSLSSSETCFAGDQVVLSLSGSFEPESVSPGCVVCRGGSVSPFPIDKTYFLGTISAN